MDVKYKPIGFFDSGVGGLSVLKEAIKLMPNENYVYFGDSKNAPYGTKTVNEVKKLSFDAVEFLLSKEIKALVVACNTATSAAIEDIRQKYKSIPVIGIEPALKPAVELHRQGKIIIMATPMTLSEKKFNKLMFHYKDEVTIESLPCPELVKLIESGIIYGDRMSKYLEHKLGPFMSHKIGAIVLGCTHYPFVKETISNIIGQEVPIIDGGYGTAKQLKRQLEKQSLVNNSTEKGEVVIYNSIEESSVVDLSYRLLSI